MKPPYQIVIDFWEGNPQILPTVLIEKGGVAGAIVRLNSMSGGNHMDDRFDENWAKAQLFEVQALYFVYNPWVTGRENFDWLINHLPLDYGTRRVFVDIEVRKSGYSPTTYGKEVAEFLRLLSAAHPVTIYSGGGFLDILTPWPKSVDYWWAGYPYALNGCEDWSEYRRILEGFDFAAATKLCPGVARMWQCSGDDVDNMPGFGGHAVDVNVFPGTLDELRAWFGCKEGEVIMANAIGLYTETANWTNPNFDFICGFAGFSWEETPSNLKAIDEKAAAEGKPFFVWYKFNVDAYSRAQFDADDARWPPPEKDEILQKLILIMRNRNIAGVVIEVLDHKDHAGTVQLPAYVSYAAGTLVGRVGDWLARNKPGVKLMVASSNAFISAYAQNMNNWVGKYNSCAVQKATKPLVDSLPAPDDKPAYLDNRATCEFWRYYEMGTANARTGLGSLGLVTFRHGDRAYLYKWLGFGQDTTAPAPVSNLVGTYEGGAVKLAWAASPSADVAYYAVDLEGEPVKSVTTCTYTDSGPIPGTYTYGVTAVDAAGNKSGRVSVVVTVPGTPPPDDLLERVKTLERQVKLLLEWAASGPAA